MSSNSLLRIPRSARGYLRFVVVSDPQDGSRYSIGVAHVLDTLGGRKYTRQIVRNVVTGHRGHIEACLCRSVFEGEGKCAAGASCLDIHVTAIGWEGRRIWRGGQPSPPAEENNETAYVGRICGHEVKQSSLTVETDELFSASDGQSTPRTHSNPSTPGSESPCEFTIDENGPCNEPAPNAQIIQWHHFPGVFVRHRNQRKHHQLLAANVPGCSAPTSVQPH